MFKNKYAELRSGWSILILFAFYFAAQIAVSILIAIVFFSFNASYLDISDYDALLAQVSQFASASWAAALSQLVSIGAVLLAFRLVYKRPLKTMGLVKRGWLKELLIGCAFGVVSICAVLGALVLFGQADVSFIGFNAENTTEILWSLVLFIGVGFNEEIMTRGYMMTALKTTRNKVVIFLFSALLFSAMHLLNANVSLLGLINIALVGILFAYMMVRSGKLWLPIGYHITWNFFQGNMLGMAVSGNETASITQTQFTGADWITGGAFGAEGGIVTTIVILLGIVFIRFAFKQNTADWTYDSDLPLVRG